MNRFLTLIILKPVCVISIGLIIKLKDKELNLICHCSGINEIENKRCHSTKALNPKLSDLVGYL